MNSSAKWFSAAESTGDFLDIRYGRISDEKVSKEVEWCFVSHVECDGIGAFAQLLRQDGAELPKLPQTRNPNRQIIKPIWNFIYQNFLRSTPTSERSPNSENWALANTEKNVASKSEALAWHLFTEEETESIRQRCRQMKVTVNSYLLKHLDQAVRSDLKLPHSDIPWMIPVNLRGDIQYADDTENHVSCVEPVISEDDSAAEIQRKIRHQFTLGEHRTKHLILKLGGFLNKRARVRFINKLRSNTKGNIGAFSNLGVWDSEKKIKNEDSWFFCPPVGKGQLLGAGCVTFQNRLSLTIQAHSDLSDKPELAKAWMQRWVDAV